MSDLERCPFCGSPVHIKRDATSGLGDFVCADGAPCRGSKLIVAFPLEHEAVAIEAWNRRAQPAQAVLAKLVPMTDEQIDESMRAKFYPARNRAFVDGVEAAEHHHGIVGEKGGAT